LQKLCLRATPWAFQYICLEWEVEGRVSLMLNVFGIYDNKGKLQGHAECRAE